MYQPRDAVRVEPKRSDEVEVDRLNRRVGRYRPESRTPLCAERREIWTFAGAALLAFDEGGAIALYFSEQDDAKDLARCWYGLLRVSEEVSHGGRASKGVDKLQDALPACFEEVFSRTLANLQQSAPSWAQFALFAEIELESSVLDSGVDAVTDVLR